jgi:hypothetical protein
MTCGWTLAEGCAGWGGLGVSVDREELFRAIRRDAANLSIRELAVRHGVHRRTVREALASSVPRPRKTPVRRSPRLDPYKKTIDEWLRADLDAPRKQRPTIKRIVARLAEDADAVVPYPTVRDYVAWRRPQIAAEAGAPAEGFIIRYHHPGLDAEVDFGDFWVKLAGRQPSAACSCCAWPTPARPCTG